MTTVAQVIETARWHILNGRRELAGSLGADCTAVATALTLSAAINGLTAGSVLELGTELVYVAAYTAGGTAVTVSRGYLGTSPAAHYTGELARVNPVVPAFIIIEKINAVLNSLSAPQNALAQMLTLDLSTGAGRLGYDLDVVDGFRDVWAVQYRVDNVGGWRKVRVGWTELEDADTTDFPSGRALIFEAALPPLSTRVWYRAAFGNVSDYADDIEASTGLPSTAIDLLAIGAAIQSVEGREISRADTLAQPDTRRAEEVQVGAATNSTARLQRRYDQRLAEECQRFLVKWEKLR